MVFRSFVVVCVATLVSACSNQLSGPSPNVEEAVVGALPLDPAIVCRDQLETEVIVRGQGFSPVVYDVPKSPKTALPTITLDLATALDGTASAGAFSLTYGGEPDQPNAALLTWESQEQMAFLVDQALELADGSTGVLEAGIYDTTITNANTQTALSVGALAVAPRPEVTGLTPGIVCLSQGPRVVTLDGTTFLRIGTATPTLEASTTFDQVALSGCSAVAHAGIDAESCTTAAFTLPDGGLPDGLHDLALRNPATAACASEETLQLRVVPPPTITSVDPTLVCTNDGSRDVIIRGTGLLQIDGVLPSVTVGGTSVTSVSVGSCTSVQTMGHVVESCDELTVTVPQQALTTPFEPEVVVTNPDPAGCSATASGLLALMPPPVITDVQPPAVCDDGGTAMLTLTGTDFVVLAGTGPTVTLNGVAVDAADVVASGCNTVTLAGTAVDQCDTLDVTFDSSTIAAATVTVAVTNPAPIGCTNTWGNDLPLVAPPAIVSAVPALTCTDDQSRQVLITGTGFLRIAGVEPTVTMSGNPVTAVAQNCTAITIGITAVEDCTELLVTAPQGSIAPGDVDIQVQNPAPIACVGGANDVLDAPPALTVDTVVPFGICSGALDTQIELQGTGFLRVDGTDPTVLLGGALVAVDAMQSCTPLTVVGRTVESCDSMLVTVLQGSLPTGDVTIDITNPAPADCALTVTGLFQIAPPPLVTSISPTAICADQATTLTIDGGGFEAGTIVTLIDTSAVVWPANSVTLVSPTQLQAEFGPGLAAGLYDLEVSSGLSCSTLVSGAVEVQATPFVFFIDPPVVYNGITTQATVYTSGLSAAASQIRLLGPSGEVETLTGTVVPGEPNRIFVSVQSGLAVGLWDVEVTATAGCVGTLVGGLSVTDTLTLTVNSIDPPLVSTNTDTAVTIDGDGFVSTPRAYLNPSGGGGVASSTRAVVWTDAQTLTGVVPAGLPAGLYDLIVVNPAGEVGFAPDALTVVANNTPVVTSVVPAALDTNNVQTATLLGDDFDAVGGVTIDFICLDSGAVEYTGTATVIATTPTEVDISIDVSAILDAGGGSVPADSVCLVRVTNADGAYFEYSAVSIRNPSQNLAAWAPGTAMQTPRRGLGLLAGRPTNASRFLHAIGGDGGAFASAMASVESVPVGLFGGMGLWVDQRNILPAARTFAGTVRLGQFLYVVGGDDGTSTTSTVYRSQILDPLATPTVVDISLEISDPPGLAAGFWYYRIAATFPANDPSNPGGESLPGEVLVVQLPATTGIELTLSWDFIPGADGYRVYRTPSADQSADQVELLAVIPGGTNTTYADNGTATTTVETPMPTGSLGVWHQPPGGSPVWTLGTPRHSLAVAVAEDPAVAGRWHLYAFGGQDGTGAYRADYEVFTIDVFPPVLPKGRQQQDFIAAATGTGTLADPRSRFGAWVVTEDDVGVGVVPAGETLIYLGPGESTGATDVVTVEAAMVPAGGDIASFTVLANADQPGTSRSGAGYADGSGFLFLFGAGGSTPSSDGVSAQVCLNTGESGCGGATPVPPNLRAGAFNGLGISMSESRIYMGTAQESAFYFVAGGFNGTSVTNSVDRTLK